MKRSLLAVAAFALTLAACSSSPDVTLTSVASASPADASPTRVRIVSVQDEEMYLYAPERGSDVIVFCAPKGQQVHRDFPTSPAGVYVLPGGSALGSLPPGDPSCTQKEDGYWTSFYLTPVTSGDLKVYATFWLTGDEHNPSVIVIPVHVYGKG